ncbi:MAG: OsmC family protein [Gemmatimonadota bacterium]|jgi:uncharacterized OsmC-like protein
MEGTFEVTLSRHDKYQFDVDFQDGSGTTLRMDEPEPLGDGAGPNAARVVAAAIGNCLSASLLFCLGKAHIDVDEVQTRITGTVVRNDRGRMRLGSLKVHIDPDVGDIAPEKMQRCLDIFEDFCLVTASVREGLEIDIDVATPVPHGGDLVEVGA